MRIKILTFLTILITGCVTWGPNNDHMTLHTFLRGLEYTCECALIYEIADVSEVTEVVWPSGLPECVCDEYLSKTLPGTGMSYHYLPDGIIRIFKLGDTYKKVCGKATSNNGLPLKDVKIESLSGVYVYSKSDGEFTFYFPVTDSEVVFSYGPNTLQTFRSKVDSQYVELIVNF